MFLGQYQHQLDDKNRIRIPVKFKNELGSEFYFAKGIGGIINVFTVAYVSAQFDKLNASISEFDSEGQDALMEYASGIYHVCEDNQGRIKLPDEIKEFGKIDKDIVTIGKGNHLSIVSAEARADMSAKATHEESMAIINKRLKNEG